MHNRDVETGDDEIREDNRDLETGDDEIREDNSSAAAAAAAAAAAVGNSAGERMVVDSRRSTPRRRHPRNRLRTRFGSSAAVGGHAAYFSFVTLPIGLIQIKYQNKNDSPFETHLIRMSISLVAICIYGLAIVFKHNVRGLPRNYSQIVNNVILIMGLLSPVSLVSIFVPNWLCWILHSIWAIFSVVVVARNWFLRIIQ